MAVETVSSVLVVGSGGREHALGWAMQKPGRQIHFPPGNGGTGAIGENVDIGVDNTNWLVNYAKDKKIDLIVVGPEAPLVAGFADEATVAGLAVFGPKKGAARLEGSKAFSAQFNERHNIPQPRFSVTTSYDQAKAWAAHIDNDLPLSVIKQDGLAAGKGVVLPRNVSEANMFLEQWHEDGLFDKNPNLVWQERLEGREVSIMAISDGTNVALFPASRDYKRRFDNEKGPNTGGMGAIAPVRLSEHSGLTVIKNEIIMPAIRGIAEEGHPFVGCLYAGLMDTDEGPKVLEWNDRFGDPEAQVLMRLLEEGVDLAQVLYDCTQGRLDPNALRFKNGVSATVVVVAKDYPDAKYKKDIPLDVRNAGTDREVFHMGTKITNGQLLSNGGRILGVTSYMSSSPYEIVNLHDALAEAYELTADIVGKSKDLDYREGIGS